MIQCKASLSDGKYMTIREYRPDGKKKTCNYGIYEIDGGDILGVISWYGAWRSFCFRPATETIFDSGCMKQIVEWLNIINTDYKEQKKVKKEDV